MPRQQLEEIARRKPTNANGLREVPEMREWQMETMADALLDAVGQ
jgi:hypothetical protein